MNAIRIGTGPPIADILKIPKRTGLTGHKGQYFGQIKPRTAPKSDNTIKATFTIDTQSLGNIAIIRVGIDIGENRTVKTSLFEQ